MVDERLYPAVRDAFPAIRRLGEALEAFPSRTRSRSKVECLGRWPAGTSMGPARGSAVGSTARARGGPEGVR
jgi:hypothetical protein